MADRQVLADRLKELRTEVLGLTQEEFAVNIGTTQSNIGQMERGERAIGKNVTFKILTTFNVNSDWWLTGEGNPLNRKELRPRGVFDGEDDSEVIQETFVTKGGNKHKFDIEGSILMEVPFVNKPAYAGYPQIFDDHVKIEETLPTILLPVEKVHRGEYRCFEVLGDSMCGDPNEPQIFEGEIVVCRRLQRHLWNSQLHLKRRRVWVIVLRNDILIKEIVNHDVKNHTITIHSFNPNKNIYPDEVISLNDVYELFYVMKKISDM